MRRFFALALLLCLSVPALAEEADLAPLAEKLTASRGLPPDKVGARDAVPELTVVKHLLRDWIERRLGAEDDADRDILALNGRLKAAGLLCDRDQHCELASQNPPATARGYLADIRLMPFAPRNRLVVVTSVGIECGYDESAYVYERQGAAWRRIFETEQNDYTEGNYLPQNFSEVLLSPETPNGKPPLVLTTGISPSCASMWQALYYRLWRVAPGDLTPKPLLDRNETIYLGDDRAIQSGLGSHDLLIEFDGNSIDDGRLVRAVLRHFKIGEGDRIERVAPFALTPRGIVDEWLTSPWQESARFTDPRARRRLKALWPAASRSRLAEYTEDGGRCRADPTRWVVGLDYDGPPGTPSPLYFILRWIAPADFTVLDIRKTPPPGCTDQPVPIDETAKEVQQFPD